MCPPTYAVVAICVVLEFADAVGAVGVPVRAGESNRVGSFTSIVGFPPAPVGFVIVIFVDPAANDRVAVVLTPVRTTNPFETGSARPGAPPVGDSSDALIPYVPPMHSSFPPAR